MSIKKVAMSRIDNFTSTYMDMFGTFNRATDKVSSKFDLMKNTIKNLRFDKKLSKFFASRKARQVVMCPVMAFYVDDGDNIDKITGAIKDHFTNYTCFFGDSPDDFKKLENLKLPKLGDNAVFVVCNMNTDDVSVRYDLKDDKEKGPSIFERIRGGITGVKDRLSSIGQGFCDVGRHFQNRAIACSMGRALSRDNQTTYVLPTGTFRENIGEDSLAFDTERLVTAAMTSYLDNLKGEDRQVMLRMCNDYLTNPDSISRENFVAFDKMAHGEDAKFFEDMSCVMNGGNLEAGQLDAESRGGMFWQAVEDASRERTLDPNDISTKVPELNVCNLLEDEDKADFMFKMANAVVAEREAYGRQTDIAPEIEDVSEDVSLDENVDMDQVGDDAPVVE